MEITLSIDRMEAGKAVLLVRPGEKEEVYWPVELLPQGAGEGHILRMKIDIDEEKTEEARTNVQNLLKKLQEKNQ